jgi:hypothetical protein
MKIIIIILVLLSPFYCLTQTDSTVYYKKKFSKKTVSKDKAKFSKSFITGTDGRKSETLFDLEKGKIVWRQIFKGEEPVGIWISELGDSTEQRDFEFNLKYTSTKFTSGFPFKFQGGPFNDDSTNNYIAPKFGDDSLSLWRYVSKNFWHVGPIARGKVYVTFIISAEGEMKEMGIIKGVSTIKDKEAMRVLRSAKIVSPAFLNGKPTELRTGHVVFYNLK